VIGDWLCGHFEAFVCHGSRNRVGFVVITVGFGFLRVSSVVVNNIPAMHCTGSSVCNGERWRRVFRFDAIILILDADSLRKRE